MSDSRMPKSGGAAADRRNDVSWIAERKAMIFLIAALAVLLPFLIQIAWPFLKPFILACILATTLDPANHWVQRRIRRPGPAALVTTLASVTVLAVALSLAGFAMARELAADYDALSRRSLNEGGWTALITHTSDRVVDAIAARIPVNKQAIREEILEKTKSATGFVLNKTAAAIGGLTSVLITGLLVTLFLYFLLRYGREWLDWLSSLVPLDPSVTGRLLQTARESVIANVNGVLAVAVAQGVLLGVAFWIVSLRSPVLWGVVGGFASIIPVVGCPVVWVPVAIGYAVSGSYWKAIFLTAWGALVVGSADNLLRPFVVGARVKQHPVLIALAVVGGTSAFGLVGILVGPLVVALAIAVVEEIQKQLSPSSSRATSVNNG